MKAPNDDAIVAAMKMALDAHNKKDEREKEILFEMVYNMINRRKIVKFLSMIKG